MLVTTHTVYECRVYVLHRGDVEDTLLQCAQCEDMRGQYYTQTVKDFKSCKCYEINRQQKS